MIAYRVLTLRKSFLGYKHLFVSMVHVNKSVKYNFNFICFSNIKLLLFTRNETFVSISKVHKAAAFVFIIVTL